VRLFHPGLDRRRRCQAGGRNGVVALLRSPPALSHLRIAVRRGIDPAPDPISPGAAAGHAGEAGLGATPAPQGRRRALRHRARRRRARGLPGNPMDDRGRHVTAPGAVTGPARAPISLAAAVPQLLSAPALITLPTINSIWIRLINHALTFTC